MFVAGEAMQQKMRLCNRKQGNTVRYSNQQNDSLFCIYVCICCNNNNKTLKPQLILVMGHMDQSVNVCDCVSIWAACWPAGLLRQHPFQTAV